MSKFFEIKQIDREAVNYLVRNLEDFEKDKAVKAGLSAAGNVFKAGGASRLKERMKSGSGGITGNLLRSIIVRPKKSKPGVLIGFKQGKGGGSHANWIDRGTNERFYTTKTGKRKSIGRVIGNTFWTDTESQDYPQAMNKLYMGIEKAVNRINNRQ
jgi:hypothetical protein